MQNGSLYNIYLHDECNICVCTLCMNAQAYTVMAENIILDFNYSKRKKRQ